MLSDEDLAIVPFNRGDRIQAHTLDQRSHIRRPGLKISQAWATVDLKSYLEVLRVYLQYFAINQFIQMCYWSANWKLHSVFEVEKYASTHLPCSPVGVVKPIFARNLTIERHGDFLAHAEL